MFASKCLGVILCHDGCSLRSRGSWLGGSLVSALSFVASAPSEVAHCYFEVGCFCWFFKWACVNMAHKLSVACAEMILRYHLFASTDPFHPLTGTCHVLCLCGCLVFCLCFVWVVFCLWLFLVLFLLLVLCVSVFALCLRDKGIGLCTGPLPVYFCSHYSFGPCMNQLINLICSMLGNMLNDLAKAIRRWKEKKQRGVPTVATHNREPLSRQV